MKYFWTFKHALTKALVGVRDTYRASDASAPVGTTAGLEHDVFLNLNLEVFWTTSIQIRILIVVGSCYVCVIVSVSESERVQTKIHIFQKSLHIENVLSKTATDFYFQINYENKKSHNRLDLYP